jgi:pimeloyl-ACP methyl ester carboxylesterase
MAVEAAVCPGMNRTAHARRHRLRCRLSGVAEVDKGGHFAAWEEPQLFAAEMRAALKSLR